MALVWVVAAERQAEEMAGTAGIHTLTEPLLRRVQLAPRAGTEAPVLMALAARVALAGLLRMASAIRNTMAETAWPVLTPIAAAEAAALRVLMARAGTHQTRLAAPEAAREAARAALAEARQRRAAMARDTRKHRIVPLRVRVAEAAPQRHQEAALLVDTTAAEPVAVAVQIESVSRGGRELSLSSIRLASHSLLGTAHFPSQASRSAWKRAAGSQQTMVSLASLVVLSALSTIDG